MSRLPRRLQPMWPLVKRLHRLAALLLGFVFRQTSRAAGSRRLPARATLSSAQTAEREPVDVRLHTSAPPELLRRSMPSGEPAAHPAFEPWLEREVSARSVLEVRGGQLIGDYAALVTPGGVLDYETSGYFGITSWRQHPLFLRPRLPEPEHVDGTLLSLTTRGTATNYYHFLLDALPRWGIFREAMPDVSVDAVYVPHRTGYQKQLIALLGLDAQPLIEVTKHRSLTAQRLLVPSTPNQDLMAPPTIVRWLRDTFPPSATTGLPRRLYITRGSVPNTRRYIEEEALWPHLAERGFARLDPATLDVQGQIDHFAAAETIVAPHGAALANLVFARDGVRVLELFARDYVNPCYWAVAESIPGARYRYLVAGSPDDQQPRPMTGVLSDISLEPTRVLDALAQLEEG